MGKLILEQAVSNHAGKCICCAPNKASSDGLSTPSEVKSSAMIRAEEVQSNLEPEFPSFMKSMVRSHVGSCFWMGLPGPFCKSRLPNEDATITLEDEFGKTYEAKYIAYKTGLSAGWRQFSVGHKLLEGDVLVFQLVEPTKFKVYIIRANDLTEVDGALVLLNLDAQTKQNNSVEKDNADIAAVAHKNTKRRRPKSLPLAVVQKKNKKTGLPTSVPNLGRPAEHSENDSENVGSEVLDGSQLFVPAVQFKDIINYENFHILVNGLLVDSELSEDVRSKYYKLCCSQNAFLHDHLVGGFNCQLIAGIISETVNIADAIRACKLTTTRDEFASWENSLKAFELLGMSVGFLHARLHRLVSFVFESEGAMDRKRYIEAKTEQGRTEDEIRNLEAKLAELKEASERFGADIESLKSKAEHYELKFQEEVTAPW
ncbi:hypothetical protein L1049_025206 [Liquidambar formosana]|uniref:TF-B3 domain-containing protein n=1 Tax=Liquidambar formosana TaxID=63359 RepID=A0AAP0RWZ8_LIQFO